jgi:hypothetical protein
MEAVMNVPHATKAVIACTGVYVLLSFFSWQSHSFGAAGVYSQTLWHGFGILAALWAVAYLGWELCRAMGVEVSYGGVTSPVLSAAGAAVLLFFNLIVFLSWGEYRTLAAWLGILLALAIGGAATWRAREEGVGLKLPEGVWLKLPEGLSLGSRSLSLPLARPEEAEPPVLDPDVQPVEA